jgi:predicted RNA-binding Zn-ribbon protein involved in translation (DUF1610 family)
MAQELEHECPECGAEKTFWRVASTTLHLGEKVKWRDGDCGYAFVTVDGIDTSDHRRN